METFRPYLDALNQPLQRERMEEVLSFIKITYPMLDTRIAWNQPTFTHQGTFIIAFAPFKAHMSMALEEKAMGVFQEQIKAAGYTSSKMLIRLPWDKPINYDLICQIIEYNMKDKEGLSSYWRKPQGKG